jgi:N-acetylglucosamine kinase-like BadF-type ATPase
LEVIFLRYYIGIDGGGTKTALCLGGADGSVLRYSKTSGTSYMEHGVDEVVKTLKAAVRDLAGEPAAGEDAVAGIAMGLPCYGESEEGDAVLERAIREAFAPVPVYLTNDVEVGWAGSMALESGINIVAGTGSIAYGKDAAGKTARCGGWSEFFGDEGSCYWAGRKVMEFFSKQSDGRMPRDALYEVVRRELNLKSDVDFIDLVNNEYRNSRKQVASLQVFAEKAALAGSAAAKRIYEEAVEELCVLVAALKNRLDFNEAPWLVSYSGGLFKAKDFVLVPFTEKIEKLGGKVVHPVFEPVEGALLLAFRHFCKEGLERIQKLLKEKG